MKKLVSILISLVCIICIALSFTGCVSKGKFYSLEQAYDNGFLTIEDLQSIAEIYNGEAVCTQELDGKTEKAIKSSIVDILKNEGETKAQIEDTEIVKFYGKYSDCFVVTYDSVYWMYPTNAVNEWFYVADIAFHKTNHLGISVWVKL